jgi:translation initiation factor 5
MLDETSELAAKLLLADKPGEEKPDPIETLVKFNKENPSNEKLAAEISRVKADEQWTDEQVSQVAFYLLFDANILKQLKMPAKISLLKEFVKNEKGQAGVLNGVVQLIGKDEALRKNSPHILKGLYDEDVVEEEALIKWHDKKSKGDTAKVKEASAVFINWLKNAEEESDEDDEEDSD